MCVFFILLILLILGGGASGRGGLVGFAHLSVEPPACSLSLAMLGSSWMRPPPKDPSVLISAVFKGQFYARDSKNAVSTTKFSHMFNFFFKTWMS